MSYYTEFFLFQESKNRLIDKLDLTDEQKEELKAFFKSHPNFENKIDWNRKDLKWEDFKEILDLEGKTKSSKKKYGLSGKAQIEDLVKGEDYEVVYEEPGMIIYYPLTFKASEVLAKPSTPPEGITGKWCIAGRNYSPGTSDQHWINYTQKQEIDFFFVFLTNAKYAIARYPRGDISIFNSDDTNVDEITDVFSDDSEVDIDLDHIKSIIDNYPRKIKLDPTLLQDYVITNGNILERINKRLDVVRIPDRVTHIASYAGYKHENIKRIIIPAAVKDLCARAFGECPNVEAIEIKTAGIQQLNVNNFPFYQCTGELYLDMTAFGAIGSGLFQYSKISAAHLNSESEEEFLLQDRAFAECRDLKSVYLGRGCTAVGTECFAHDTELTQVWISKTTKAIKGLAFTGCKNLTEVNFFEPGSCEYIGAYAFACCSSLESLRIPDNCLAIWEHAFNRMPNLSKLSLPESLETLGQPLGDDRDYTLFGEELPENLSIVFRGTADQWLKLIAPIKRYSEKEYSILYNKTRCLKG